MKSLRCAYRVRTAKVVDMRTSGEGRKLLRLMEGAVLSRSADERLSYRYEGVSSWYEGIILCWSWIFITLSMTGSIASSSRYEEGLSKSMRSADIRSWRGPRTSVRARHTILRRHYRYILCIIIVAIDQRGTRIIVLHCWSYISPSPPLMTWLSLIVDGQRNF